MKREMLFVVTCLLVALFATTAFGAQGIYLSGRGGAVTQKSVQLESTTVDFDPGVFVAGAVGYGLGEGRVEAEIGYRRNTIEQIVLKKGNKFEPGGDFSSLSFMLNSMVDYQYSTDLSPYLFVGGGVARIAILEDLSLGVGLNDSQGFFLAYQAGAGVNYPLTKNLFLDLEYRYFAALDPKFEMTTGEDLEFDYATQNVSLGIKYLF